MIHPTGMPVPSPADPDVTLRARRLIAFAAVAIAIALCFSNGHLDPLSLAAMTLAMAAGVGAALLGRRPSLLGPSRRLESWVARAPDKLLWAGILLSLAIDVVLPPGYYADRTRLGLFRPLVAAAALLVWSYRWRRQPRLLVRVRFPLFLVLAAVMSVVVIRASPRPAIDVWYVLQYGAEGLAHGQNPYALEYPNIYGAGSPYYSKEILNAAGTHTRGYPYLPLPLLLSVPSALLAHDVRWLFLACVLFAAWAIRRLGRRALEAELAAVLLLMQPRAFFLLEQSWTEPLVLAAVMLTLLAAVRWCAGEAKPRAGAWVTTGLAAALAAASKQYSPIILLPLLLALPARGRWKAAALAVGAAGALMLPFLFWDRSAFIAGIVANQRQPFRTDALSWLAAVAWAGGPQLPFWPAFAAAGATLAATLGRRISLAQAATVAGATLLVLLLLHKQSFCNYYWLAGGMILAATALHAGSRAAPEEEALAGLEMTEPGPG